MANVTKADGSLQPFDREKVVRTCLRMRAPPEVAQEVANKIEQKVYEGIPTKKILQLIFNYLKKYKPEIRHTKDLRTSITLLRSKPDFEYFVGFLLQGEGYEVKMNRILQGKCVDHEVDVIASKGSETLYVEVKHHSQPHIYTGLDVFLEANSAFEDLVSGFGAAKNGTNFTKAYVITNTKISDYAKRYSSCQGIGSIAWKTPEKGSLEDLIEKHRFYPITILKGLDNFSFTHLADSGMILLKQLTETEENEIQKKTQLPISKVEELVTKAREILSR